MTRGFSSFVSFVLLLMLSAVGVVSAFINGIRYSKTSASNSSRDRTLMTRNRVFAPSPRHNLLLQQKTALYQHHDQDNNQDETIVTTSTSANNVLGASLLFAGTAIGAGMLALPAETATAGFVPSVTTLLACWLFTIVTSLVTLEASWSVRNSIIMMEKNKHGDDDMTAVGFLSITKMALGPVGEGITALLFWFLLTSIVVAYTSEGGQLLSQAVTEVTGMLVISPAVGSAIFVSFFASLGIFGTTRVDLVNRFLVAGLVASFVGLVGVSVPGIRVENLFRVADWTRVYPQVISIGILSFGAQNVVPTLLQYLGGDARLTQRAILIGSLIPLCMYGIWEAVVLGIVPLDAAADDSGDGGSKMQIVTALGTVGGVVVKDLVEVFSACAIGSSMAGASVSLVDFFEDALSTLKTTDNNTQTTSDRDDTTTSPAGRSPTPPNNNKVGVRGSRLLAATLALVPPLGVAWAFPDAFLGALENAGLIGGVSLYGILPALAVLNLRRQQTTEATVKDERGKKNQPVDEQEGHNSPVVMPGRLVGGDNALYGIAAVSAALILPEFVRLLGNSGDMLFLQ